MKRLFDIVFSIIGLIIFSPIIFIFLILVFLNDWKSPIYIAPRGGKFGKIFNIVKIRSMVFNADKNKVDSTSSNDKRITKIGKIIRKFKLDEITQLWNVLLGDMSFVGPRPNVIRDINLYTKEERKLLTVKPGITDFSSIIFSDEGDILRKFRDPDLAYNQLIRPWKSRLGLFYIKNKSLFIDIQLILITLLTIYSRNKALKIINRLLKKLNAPTNLIEISKREKKLIPFPPPGSKEIVKSRGIN